MAKVGSDAGRLLTGRQGIVLFTVSVSASKAISSLLSSMLTKMCLAVADGRFRLAGQGTVPTAYR